MRRPKNGWTDAALRVGSWTAMGMSLLNLGGQSAWSVAWLALSVALRALSGVERLRQGLVHLAALRDGGTE